MRILVLSKDFPAPGQPEEGIAVLRQARALASLGHELLVVRVVPYAPALTQKWRRYRAVPERYLIEGIPVRTVRAIFPPRMIGMEYLPLQVDAAIEAIVVEHRPEVIHAHCLIPSGQLAVRHRVPSVVTAHGSDAYDWPFRRAGLKRAAASGIRGASAVVAVSDFIRQCVVSIADRDVEVIHNGADESVFTPMDTRRARAELDLPQDRFLIAFAGGPPGIKGVFDLTKAVASMTAHKPLLVLAGPSADGPSILQSAGTAGADVRFFGMLDHPRLALLMNACDVFCLPSYREGLPLVLCEAMLTQRPIVTTPVGGIPEIVADGRTGYLVPPGDVGALAARLSAVANEPHQAQQVADAAYAFARERLTWTANARRYSELYERVAERFCPEGERLLSSATAG